MTKQKQATGQAEITIPAEVEVELTNLRGFRDLVGERFGYWLGRRLKQTEMNDATKEERKAVSEVRKSINIEEFIQNSDLDGYKTKLQELDAARKVVSDKAKPFREKISPLTSAVGFLDKVAIPDALKELGTPVQPRFSLSEFVKTQLAQQKKR